MFQKVSSFYLGVRLQVHSRFLTYTKTIVLYCFVMFCLSIARTDKT